MKYDFTTIIDRKGKDALAVDILPAAFGTGGRVEVRDGLDCIPMWVADMNFATVPAVTEAIIERAKHPTYGYFMTSQEYYNKIIEWQVMQNAVSGLEKEHIGYENGVLGGAASALHVLCSQGDSILVHAPTYIGFTNTLKNNGYNIVHSPLKKDGGGVWRMDFEDMEEKILKNKIHCAIFCSPHNPTGRVWEKREIEKAMEIYAKHDVYVISDEIWSDIVLYGNRHIPTQSVSEDARNRTVALYAPSKTFNLAGLIGSYHIIYNDWLRERIRKEASLGHYNSINVLSMHALTGAYGPEGREWVEELREVIGGNVKYACDFIDERLEGVSVSRPQGTYMLFVDCVEWCRKHGKTPEELLRAGFEAGVFWQSGKAFQGEWHIRMNLASPFTMIREAFDRLEKYVFCI